MISERHPFIRYIACFDIRALYVVVAMSSWSWRCEKNVRIICFDHRQSPLWTIENHLERQYKYYLKSVNTVSWINPRSTLVSALSKHISNLTMSIPVIFGSRMYMHEHEFDLNGVDYHLGLFEVIETNRWDTTGVSKMVLPQFCRYIDASLPSAYWPGWKKPK